LAGESRSGTNCVTDVFVEEGLLREIENPFEAVQWQMVLGSESLVQRERQAALQA
jgi:hypothetical protein